jgi:porin
MKNSEQEASCSFIRAFIKRAWKKVSRLSYFEIPLFFCMFYCFCTGAVLAQDQSGKAVEQEPCLTDANALPAWQEFFSDLKERGISFKFNYIGESFTSTGSGLREPGSTDYEGLGDIIVTIDTEKSALWWSGGEIFIHLENQNGQGIAQINRPYIRPLSDIASYDYTKLSQYGIKQNFFGSRLKIKAGRQDANDLFNSITYTDNFIIPSFTLNPTAVIPTFPYYPLGATAVAKPVDWLDARFGIFDESNEKSGFFGIKDAFRSTVFLFEPALNVSFGADGKYSGAYRFGAWYQTGEFTEISSESASENLEGNYGFYLGFSQQLYLENDDPAENPEGLGSFLEWGWAPEDRNIHSFFYAVGFLYTGLIPGRDSDELGFGAALTRLSSELAVSDRNQIEIELHYRMQLKHWLHLQPAVLFLDDPADDIHNAVVLGARFGIQF